MTNSVYSYPKHFCVSGKTVRLPAAVTTTIVTTARSMTENPMKRVNIQLSVNAHTQAKILAVLQGKTLNDYLAAAVEQRVKKDEGLLKQLGNNRSDNNELPK